MKNIYLVATLSSFFIMTTACTKVVYLPQNQQPSPSNQLPSVLNPLPSTMDTVTVTGVIMAENFQTANAQGVPNAKVQLDGTTHTTQTDAEGRFVLKDIPMAQVRHLTAKKSDANGRQLSVHQPLSPSSSGQLNLDSLFLKQAGSIYGVVKANGATELLGTDVFIEGTTLVAKTDQDGNYFLANVPVGTFNITALRVNFKSVTQQVTVESGKPVALNLELTEPLADSTSRLGMIEGSILSDRGPVAGATVTIPSKSYISITDKEGKFQLSNVLPKADYPLLVLREGFESQEVTVAVNAGETTHQDFNLNSNPSEPPGTIKGTLKDSSGQPLVDASVVTDPPTADTRTDPQGNFTIPNAPPGSYYVKGIKEGQLKGSDYVSLDPGQVITRLIQGTIIAGGDVNICNNLAQNNVNVNAPGSQVNVNINSDNQCNINSSKP